MMIWSEMAVRLRAPGQGTDMVHRIVETLRDEISAGSLRGGSRITGEKQLAAILRVSRSTLREALRILVHEGFLVSRWGVGTFVTDQLPSIVKGHATNVNVPLPLQWIEPHWTLLTDEEKAVAADDVVAAALDIAPGENVSRRRRTYGISGRILAFADETVLARLKDSLKSHPGTTPVSIRLIRPGEFEATLKAADSMRIALSPRLTSEIRALAGEDSVQYVFE